MKCNYNFKWLLLVMLVIVSRPQYQLDHEYVLIHLKQQQRGSMITQIWNQSQRFKCKDHFIAVPKLMPCTDTLYAFISGVQKIKIICSSDLFQHELHSMTCIQYWNLYQIIYFHITKGVTTHTHTHTDTHTPNTLMRYVYNNITFWGQADHWQRESLSRK